MKISNKKTPRRRSVSAFIVYVHTFSAFFSVTVVDNLSGPDATTRLWSVQFGRFGSPAATAVVRLTLALPYCCIYYWRRRRWLACWCSWHDKEPTRTLHSFLSSTIRVCSTTRLWLSRTFEPEAGAASATTTYDRWWRQPRQAIGGGWQDEHPVMELCRQLF